MAIDPLRKRKIAVLGSRSVGKSSLVNQFAENNFMEGYFPTIENTVTKNVKHKGIEYECDIIDTAGQDEYSILSPRHCIGIHGYVLVYSVTSRDSLNMVKVVHDKIADFTGEVNIPVVVVGQKSDLPNRQVPANEGQKVAEEFGGRWIETSARKNQNIDKVFDMVLGEIEKFSTDRNGRQAPAPARPNCLLM